MPSLPTLAAGLAGGFALLAFAMRPPSPAAPQGHLVLQIEGDALALRVTRITVKPDPCGRNRIDSAWRIVAFDAAGRELGGAPLDLRQFDLDPAHVGAPLRVVGCRIVDTRVATLANLPHWPDTVRLAIVEGGRMRGAVDPTRYAALLAGEVR
jgi:hypothetical protein